MQPSTAAKPGRYTAKFWESRVFRPTFENRKGVKQACGNYYVRIKFGGQRKSVPLHTSDRTKAGKRSAKFYSVLRVMGWETALKDLDPQQSIPKSATPVGDIAVAVKAADLHPRTRDNYVAAIRWFGARLLGIKATKKTFGPSGSSEFRQKVDSLPLASLTKSAISEIFKALEEKASPDLKAQRSARISGASYLRNAKAAIRAAGKAGVQLPEPLPFVGVEKPADTRPAKYINTFDAGNLIRNAKAAFKSHPGAYIAVLLALGAGLRRDEIRTLRWRHVDKKNNRVLVITSTDWKPKTPGSEDEVFVDPGLLGELEPFRSKLDDPVSTPKDLDEAVKWLRGQGINEYKPLHTLRKEFGSLICADADLLTASRQLRHNNIATTAAVYVESRRRIAPRITAMLTPPQKE